MDLTRSKLLTDLASQLENLCVDLKEKLHLEKRIRDIADQNTELRNLLGRLKAQVFEEKEINLRLRSEIACLKTQEIVDHKKIQALLALSNRDEQTVELFIRKDWPSEHCHPSNLRNCPDELGLETENEILRIKIKALKAELNERTELLLCERDALIQDKTNLLRESEKSRVNNDLDALFDRLDRVQKSIRNICNPRAIAASHVPVSNKASEVAKENVHIEMSQPPNGRISSITSSVVNNLKSQLKKSDATQQRLKNRISVLQADIERISARKPPNTDSNQRLNERIQILTTRNNELERRRKLENEGFRSDIKILRENLKEIEKQLLKVILSVGDKKDVNVDLSTFEVYENPTKGADAVLMKLRDLQKKLP